MVTDTQMRVEDMRIIQVVGSVRFSPHIKTAKDGRQYVHFTIASNPAQETPRPQFHIRVFDKDLMLMAMKLKSGTKLCVTGEYQDSIAIVAGCLLICQQIIASSIEFVQIKTHK